jgi:putative transport protein
MSESIVNDFAQFPVLTLFVVIGLGYVVGDISILGFRLGVVGVLFVGLAIGALGPQVTIPEIVPTLGLIIFIYALGIQAGPGFFHSFGREGKRRNLLAVGVLVVAALLAWALQRPLHMSGPRAAGLYSGALTNAPALAATREVLRDRAVLGQITQPQSRTLLDEAVVACSIAYPFGVIGMLLWFQLLMKFFRPVLEPGERGPEIQVRDFSVENPGIFGRTLGDVLQPYRDMGLIVSRLQHNGSSELARSDLRLEPGDVVAVVGEPDTMELAEQIFGASSSARIELDSTELDTRRVFVSSHNVVGARIRDLDLENSVGAQITRLRRGDVDIVPTPNTRLEFGDVIRVLAHRDQFSAVSGFFGDSIRGTAETDFGSVALGMVIGVIVGLITIPLPHNEHMRLGLAGGPLLVALVLGKLERTGKITWIIPVAANKTLRELGLLLFLAGVGVNAGYQFVHTLNTQGLLLLIGGAIITSVATVLTVVLAYKWLRVPFDTAMGLASGIQTQPACLAYAISNSQSERPNLAYASVYPIAMIAKIILAQLLA